MHRGGRRDRGHRQGAGALLRGDRAGDGPDRAATPPGPRRSRAEIGGPARGHRARPRQAEDDPRRAGVGRPGPLPRDRRHPARRQHDPRLRHRPGAGAGDAQARRLRRGRPRAARPAAARQLDRAVRRQAKDRPYPGLDDGLDGQRRRSPGSPGRWPGSWRRSGSTPSTRGSPATARTGTASRRPSSRATRRRPSPRSSRRWTISSTARGSSSRTRRSKASTSSSTTDG